PTAGEGVINQRGEQVPMPGEPVRRGMGVSPLRTARKTAEGLDNATLMDIQRLANTEALGASQRTAEGEMPTGVNGINVKRFAPDSEELQNVTAGLAKKNEAALNEQRGEFSDVLERAAKIDKWQDIKKVEALKPNEILNDENM